ncbi:Octapeptide-repeat protein T2 [Bifidobacterium samirii]|uniref:Octapeptide-repeat protein T2 n=1 Tax=Bifidobacterium samirii TaxID=2306974 RepID=A0A430FWM9_9BIFI|nr:Octapeptide-repeat protein T2 [Bifidobacterium samirii]
MQVATLRESLASQSACESSATYESRRECAPSSRNLYVHTGRPTALRITTLAGTFASQSACEPGAPYRLRRGVGCLRRRSYTEPVSCTSRDRDEAGKEGEEAGKPERRRRWEEGRRKKEGKGETRKEEEVGRRKTEVGKEGMGKARYKGRSPVRRWDSPDRGPCRGGGCKGRVRCGTRRCRCRRGRRVRRGRRPVSRRSTAGGRCC